MGKTITKKEHKCSKDNKIKEKGKIRKSQRKSKPSQRIRRNNQQLKNLKTHHCDFCSKAYASDSSLKLHNKLKHPKDKLCVLLIIGLNSNQFRSDIEKAFDDIK